MVLQTCVDLRVRLARASCLSKFAISPTLLTVQSHKPVEEVESLGEQEKRLGRVEEISPGPSNV